MTSIYERVLGSDFARLHPQMQKRFGFASADGIAAIGHGTMEEIWRGAFYTLPFLWLGSFRRILLPIHGRDVPFTIRNYAYRDRYGRETVTWIRSFECEPVRRFDATMIYSAERERIVDYLGTHQHLAVDIGLHVDERGGMELRSGSQRFYEGPIAFPFPMLFSGVAEVREWYDDVARCFRISVDVSNRVWGPLFGYRGSFQVEWIACTPADVPADVKPLREERRE